MIYKPLSINIVFLLSMCFLHFAYILMFSLQPSLQIQFLFSQQGEKALPGKHHDTISFRQFIFIKIIKFKIYKAIQNIQN